MFVAQNFSSLQPDIPFQTVLYRNAGAQHSWHDHMSDTLFHAMNTEGEIFQVNDIQWDLGS